LTAEEVVGLLGLAPHPEGGFYRETFRDASPDGGRGASTAIYYLLRRGEISVWHRVHDVAEVWHYYAGAPLELTLSPGRGHTTLHLGPDLAAGERPQAVVLPGIWQAAKTLGDWTLVGCTVAPAFEFSAFEMAPPGWEPEAEVGG
jgi:predicted cupin superfamily sugar epimerase